VRLTMVIAACIHARLSFGAAVIPAVTGGIMGGAIVVPEIGRGFHVRPGADAAIPAREIVAVAGVSGSAAGGGVRSGLTKPRPA
jgi:hypothetical protein